MRLIDLANHLEDLTEIKFTVTTKMKKKPIQYSKKKAIAALTKAGFLKPTIKPT